MSIHDFAQSLRREAQAWARALRHVDAEADVIPTDELFSSVIGSGETTFTAAFALSRLLIALGRFSSVQATLQHLWPSDRSLQTKIQGRSEHLIDEVSRTPGSISELAPGLAKKLNSEPGLAVRLFTEKLFPPERNINSDNWEDVYHDLCEWRLAVAASWIDGLEIGSSLLAVIPGPHVDVQLQMLDSRSRRTLNAAVREYLAYEWICTWAHSFEPTRQSHMLFERVLLITQGEGSLRGQTVDDLLGEILAIDRPLLRDFAGVLREILQSLSGMLGDWGLERTIDAIEEGAAPWSDSGSIASGRGVNVIPSEVQGNCQAVLLALMASRRRSGNLKTVLRQVRAHLINCFQQCRIVLLVTDHWDKKYFDESALDLRAHSARGIIFVPILVTGHHLRVLEFDV